MKKIAFFILVFSFKLFVVNAQNVGIGTDSPHVSAKLEVSSNNSGFLPPRMTTTQRNTIVNPVAGLQIYNTTTDCLEIFSKGRWQKMFCGVDDTTTTVDSTLVTDIDGHTYPTVKICNQTWMAKNLDVARYRNGDIIPQVTDPSEWANLTTGAWCWYNNDSATYGSVYGRLYNWYAVSDPRGLAPEGWHVPSDAEWTTLTDCLGGADVAGGKLKEAGTTHWNSPNTGATNSSGFFGLPSGYRGSDGRLNAVGQISVFGSITIHSNNDVWRRIIYFESESVSIATDPKTYGYAIRCVKDTPITTLNDGLVAYYPFNGNANDESGNGNNGTVNGASLTTDRFGNSGKAYSFDGISNYIETADIDLNETATISVWVQPIGTIGSLVSKYGNGNESYELMYNNSTHGLYGHVGAVSNSNNNIYSNHNLSINNIWQHCVFTLNNGFAEIYIDGVLVYTQTDVNPTYQNNDNVLFGKSVWGGNIFNGKLDDIRIYNRALTQAEITYLATH